MLWLGRGPCSRNHRAVDPCGHHYISVWRDGAFDWLCARQVYQAKQQYSEVECLLVIPYLSFRIRERKYFDDILDPEGFEKYHFKAAIPERNRFMVNHSSWALCYVDHDWGGAAKTYRLAVRQGLQIINLGEVDNGKSHI